MSVGQPPNLPPPPAGYPPPPPAGVMPPPLYGATMQTPPAPARRGLFDFKGMQWWEIVLALVPLSLIILGGLIGAAFGVLASFINLRISRSLMSTATKALLMIGVDVTAALLYVIAAIILLAAVRSAAG